mmetsp:Transcript_58411/g.131591  ORF Transcript_58411/g.131591 Transcript_58411/m.131591 type:complete len:236 (-) Transcript_58411:113-820(-)
MGAGGSAGSKYRPRGQATTATDQAPVRTVRSGGYRAEIARRRASGSAAAPGVAAEGQGNSFPAAPAPSSTEASTAEGPPSSASRAVTPSSIVSGASGSARSQASVARTSRASTPSLGQPEVPPASMAAGAPPPKAGQPVGPLHRVKWQKAGTSGPKTLPPLRPPASGPLRTHAFVPPDRFAKASPVAHMAAEYWKRERRPAPGAEDGGAIAAGVAKAAAAEAASRPAIGQLADKQ